MMAKRMMEDLTGGDRSVYITVPRTVHFCKLYGEMIPGFRAIPHLELRSQARKYGIMSCKVEAVEIYVETFAFEEEGDADGSWVT